MKLSLTPNCHPKPPRTPPGEVVMLLLYLLFKSPNQHQKKLWNKHRSHIAMDAKLYQNQLLINHLPNKFPCRLEHTQTISMSTVVKDIKPSNKLHPLPSCNRIYALQSTLDSIIIVCGLCQSLKYHVKRSKVE